MANNANLLRLPSSSKTRKQVSLDLTQPESLMPPSVSGGNYSVAVENFKPSRLGDLVQSLGQFASVGLKAVTEQRIEQDEETAKLMAGISPKEAKVLLSGDRVAIENELKDTTSRLDAAQRKNLLKFIENPQNFVRANRVLGGTVATDMVAEVMANPDQYINSSESIESQMEKLKKDVVKTLNLQGSAYLAFQEVGNQLLTNQIPNLQQRQNASLEADYITKTTGYLQNLVQRGDYQLLLEEWNTNLNGHGAKTQEEVLKGVVQGLINKGDFASADAFIDKLESLDLVIGRNAKVADTLLSELSVYAEDQARIKNNQLKADASYMVDQTQAQFNENLRKIRQGLPVEDFEVPLSNGQSVTIKGGNVSQEDYLTSALAALDSNADSINVFERELFNKFGSAIEDLSVQEQSFIQKAGVNAVMDTFDAVLRKEDPEMGANLYGLNSDQINAQAEAWEAELKAEVESIYNNFTDYKTEAQRQTAAYNFVRKFRNDKLDALQMRSSNVTDEQKINRLYESYGVGLQQQPILRDTQRTIAWLENSEFTEITGANTDFVKTSVEEHVNAKRDKIRELWTQPRFSGETDIEYYNRRRSEIEQYTTEKDLEFSMGIRDKLENWMTPLDYQDVKTLELAESKWKTFEAEANEVVTRFKQVDVGYGQTDKAAYRIPRKEAWKEDATSKKFAAPFYRWLAVKRWGMAEIGDRIMNEGGLGVLPSELAANVMDGVPIDRDNMKDNEVPLLSKSLILGVFEDAKPTIQEFIKAFGGDYNDPKAMKDFWENQKVIFAKEYGISAERLVTEERPPTDKEINDK